MRQVRSTGQYFYYEIRGKAYAANANEVVFSGRLYLTEGLDIINAIQAEADRKAQEVQMSFDHDDFWKFHYMDWVVLSEEEAIGWMKK